jgi:hypothetical protein
MRKPSTLTLIKLKVPKTSIFVEQIRKFFLQLQRYWGNSASPLGYNLLPNSGVHTSD